MDARRLNRDFVLSDAPMCASGKRGFETEQEARATLSVARQGRSEGWTGRTPGRVETAVYECLACHWWHLASAPRRQTKSTLANRKRYR